MFPFLLFLFFATLPFQFALSPASGIDLHVSRLFAIGLFALWLIVSLFRRSLPIPRHPETALLFSFLFLSGFSLFFAEQFLWGLRKLAFLLSFFPIFFVAFSVFREEKNRKKLLAWLVFGSALSAIIGIAQFFLPFVIGLDPAILAWQKNLLPIFSGQTFSGVVSEYSSMVVNVGGINFLRASAFFPDPHIASFFWGMTLPLALVMGSRASGQTRSFFLTAALLILSADLLTFSRGGYLALLAALFVFLAFFFSPALKKHIPELVLFCFIFALFIVIPNPLFGRLSSMFDSSDNSTNGRLAIWSEAVHIIAEHPVTGVGLGNYSNTVKPSALYREPRYAHNIFLDIAAETGIANALLFLFLLTFAITRAFTHRHNSLSFAAGCSLLIFSTHALFETPLYSVHILPLFLTLVAFAL